VVDVLGQFFATGFPIPFLVGFRLNFPLNQELREFPALGLTFERHNVTRSRRQIAADKELSRKKSRHCRAFV